MAVLDTKKSRRYTVRKAAPAKAPAKPAPKQRVARARPERLPGWGDLASRNERFGSRGRAGTFLEKVPTGRFALLVLGLAVMATVYVGHVLATQDVLAEVQVERRENLSLHLKYNRLKGEFDQMTGPAVIHERARALGLVEDVAYGPTIKVGE
jgi:hypothetical protein